MAASVSEKPFIPASGPNPYPFEPYFDDPQTPMQRLALEEHVSRYVPQMKTYGILNILLGRSTLCV
jgi:hypothetical protein